MSKCNWKYLRFIFIPAVEICRHSDALVFMSFGYSWTLFQSCDFNKHISINLTVMMFVFIYLFNFNKSQYHRSSDSWTGYDGICHVLCTLTKILLHIVSSIHKIWLVYLYEIAIFTLVLLHIHLCTTVWSNKTKKCSWIFIVLSTQIWTRDSVINHKTERHKQLINKATSWCWYITKASYLTLLGDHNLEKCTQTSIFLNSAFSLVD